jgi:hypothetical protein
VRCISLPLWERKDFLGFSRFAKFLENPSEGVVQIIIPSLAISST